MSVLDLVAIIVGNVFCFAIGHMLGWQRGYSDCALEAKSTIRELQAKIEELEEEDEVEDEDWWKGD